MISALKRNWCLWLVLLLLAFFLFTRTDLYKSVIAALSPPDLPELQVKDADGEWLPQVWLNQNWGNTLDNASPETRKYHHLSQGTRTVPVPYNWLVNLEQPKSSPYWILFGEKPLFVQDDYLLRFGFIRSKQDPELNPHGLPVGFARTPSQNVKGFTQKTDTIGFTCAACHTGHFVDEYNGKAAEYIVEGGPAAMDLGQFGLALSAALGQTVLSSKIPLLDGRYDRFARRVLGEEYSPTTKRDLSSRLLSFVGSQLGGEDTIQVTEGYTRLDALNRIGNGVFSDNINRPQNYAPITAPVNYPHIWTTSWFDWVQYDGSVMGPLIRNVGEALGVKAFMDVKSPPRDNRFSSSIPIDNLVWMEEFLGGSQPGPEHGWSGLLAPQWLLTDIDKEQARTGRQLYKTHCQQCHLPSLASDEIWDEKYFGPIYWNNGFEDKASKDHVLQLKLIPVKQVGTDPAQANVMATRTMDTSGVETGPVSDYVQGMDIDSVVCMRQPDDVARANIGDPREWQAYRQQRPTYQSSIPLVERMVVDGANVGFGFALAATVQKTIDAWYKVNHVEDPALRERMDTGRPNCIQAGAGYKARPLNGVWATPPFLHNGSVATIRDLLCPVGGRRPEVIQLGNPQYDRENLGILQPQNYAEEALERLDNNELYDQDGYFTLDTRVPGNLNQGHRFSNEYNPELKYWLQSSGVIGPELSTEECSALMEYLKVIGTAEERTL